MSIADLIRDKRRYRAHRSAVAELPPAYRDATLALERYLMYFGGIADGAVMNQMLDDLLDLMQQAVADSTPLRQVVGADPVEFAEDFLRTYSDSMWITKERDRLVGAIDRAVAARS